MHRHIQTDTDRQTHTHTYHFTIQLQGRRETADHNAATITGPYFFTTKVFEGEIFLWIKQLFHCTSAIHIYETVKFMILQKFSPLDLYLVHNKIKTKHEYNNNSMTEQGKTQILFFLIYKRQDLRALVYSMQQYNYYVCLGLPLSLRYIHCLGSMSAYIILYK